MSELPWRRAEARRNKGPDLTKGGTLCLSKAVLGSCCKPLPAEAVYSEYFKPFTLVDDETNLSCLKSRPNQELKIRNSMFQLSQPLEEPAFFNFNSHADINRLAQVIGKNIVIYFVNEKWSFFEIYHDFRAFNNNLVSIEQSNEEEEEEDSVDPGELNQSATASSSASTTSETFFSTSKKWRQMRERNKAEKRGVFYVLTTTRCLYQFDECLDDLLDTCCPFFANDFWRLRVNHPDDDYGVLLAQVIGKQPPPFPIASICELTFHLRHLWDLWHTKIILVNFCRLNFNQKNSDKFASRRQNPKYSYFFNLGVIAPPAESEVGEKSVASLNLQEFEKCVCFYGNTFACELKDIFRAEVVAQYKKTSRRDKPSSNNFARIPSVSLDEQRKALAIELRKKKLKQMRKRKLEVSGVTEEDDNDLQKQKNSIFCSCSKCSSDEYNLNMNERGPERLCTYNLDVTDLLYFLGADSPSNLAIMEKLSELSVASMDIESMTVQVHLEPPVRQQGGILYGTIDEASLGGHLKKVQKPIMIAHTDKITTDEGNEDVTVFTAVSDAEEDIYAMMRSYWAHVKSQQYKAQQLKTEIATPLFQLISSYKTTHFEVYQQWCAENLVEPDGRLITKAWYQSLPGQLEKRLRRLVVDYNVFSFYG